MDFGFSVPTRGPLANKRDLVEIARTGEALGFGILAIPDHILVPRRIDSRYPYSQEGDWPGAVGGECLEQLTLMAWLAAATERARLLTSVMVVPHRKPVHTAKILSTIDVLSGGRAVLGCGTGWMREEFEAIGTEPFEARGRVTDEYIRAFRELWYRDDPSFAGEFVSFRDIVFEPKPVQKPLPIWIGGESGRALKRAASLGDGWYPIGANPRDPLNTVPRYAAALERLKGHAEEAGRDPAEITLAFWANWPGNDHPIRIEKGQRFIMTGGADEVAEDIAGLGALGVEHVLFNFQRPSRSEMLEAMQRFVEEIRPKVSA